MDISGRWKGYYVQAMGSTRSAADTSANRHPIEANFQQQNSLLSGEMFDEDLLFYVSTHQILFEMKSSAKRRSWELFLERYPDTTYRIEMPEKSSLQGKIVGNKVRFVKSYLEPQRQIISYGGKEISTPTNGKIDYMGALSDSGDRIEGSYRVTRNPFSSSWWILNHFVLERCG